MKKILALALAILMVFSLVACGSSAPAADVPAADAPAADAPAADAPAADEPAAKEDPYLAYFISIKTGGAAWSKTERGFNDICKELGWEGHYVAPQTPMDPVEMAQLLDTAINEGADFIAGIFFSEELFGDSLKRAREQGIVICNINVTIGEEGEYTDFNMGTNQYNMGVRQGELLKELAGDKAYKVLYLCGSAGEILNTRYDGFLKTLEGCTNITQYGMEFEQENAVIAADVVSNVLRANPDINCIVCNDSTGATMGSSSYIDENGLKDDILVIGMDDSADILNYLKAGILDVTIATGNYSMGYDSVRIANDMIVNGIKPAYENDTGTVPIFPADVDAYAAENGIDLG